ncbi:hypothetical protein [Sphingobacterium sp. FBM7-1]|uniref:hypothetical protein n=1 Tax=Sphingobacterium sp. FBM7-1 TaxID=2886688 RepID=UPI001D114150|nr:hypothetical protein [Sphingobacterium sp. FBM7-1]MCC2600714.1 hypothetical protein [Sphingobacterium sp. FBM7-1]
MKGTAMLTARGRSVLISFLVLIASYTAKAQDRVFVLNLDSLNIQSDFDCTQYTLSTEALYPVNQKVHLYNLLPKSHRHRSEIIVFAVLPDFEKKSSWTEIKRTDIREISYSELLNFKDRSLGITTNPPYFTRSINQIKLAILHNGKLKVGNQTFLQFFAVRNYVDGMNRPLGTIDIGQPFISIYSFSEAFKRQYPDDSFPMLPERISSSFEPLRMKKEFLSKKLTIEGEEAYRFWTFYDWSTADGYEIERGLDRFVYMPGRGIVGASLDFYFFFHLRHNGLTNRALIQNMWEEKVMLADELTGRL